MKRVLAFVAHADDEVLGCGGTLAKHAEAGDQILTVVCCPRGLGHEYVEAGKVLGVTWSDSYDFPDQKLDSYPMSALITAIEMHRDSHKPPHMPDIVYTHNLTDLNLDHRLVAEAVMIAFRPPHSRTTILTFETISSTEWGVEPFAPNWYEELTYEQVEKKVAALACYPGERRPSPHPRNAHGVFRAADYRGAQAGVEYAEAFRLIRHVN